MLLTGICQDSSSKSSDIRVLPPQSPHMHVLKYGTIIVFETKLKTLHHPSQSFSTSLKLFHHPIINPATPSSTQSSHGHPPLLHDQDGHPLIPPHGLEQLGRTSRLQPPLRSSPSTTEYKLTHNKLTVIATSSSSSPPPHKSKTKQPRSRAKTTRSNAKKIRLIISKSAFKS